MSLSPSPAPGAPARSIGLVTATALVAGNMIGSGVYVLPASLAPLGAAAVGGWLVTAAGAVCLALVFAHLAARNPAAGGFYAWTRVAFGDFAGFLVAWGYWIGCWVGNAAIAMGLSGALRVFAPSMSDRGTVAAAAGAVLLAAVVNTLGVRSAGRFQVVTLAIKILPLLAFSVVGVTRIPEAVAALSVPAKEPFMSSVGVAITLTLWAFLGLEAASVPAGHIQDPARTIPRATVGGVLLSASVYIFATLGVVSILPRAAAAVSSAPFADAARLLSGNAAAYVVAAGAAVACIGTLNGFTLLMAEFPAAVADDGLFPAPFARRNGRGVPLFSLWLSTGLTTALLSLHYLGTKGFVAIFDVIVLLSTLAILIPYAFTALAPFAARADRPRRGAAAVAVLAFVYSLAAIFGSGADTVRYGFLLLLAGLPAYLFVKARSSR